MFIKHLCIVDFMIYAVIVNYFKIHMEWNFCSISRRRLGKLLYNLNKRWYIKVLLKFYDLLSI